MFTKFIIFFGLAVSIVLFLCNFTLPMLMPKSFSYGWMFRRKKKGKIKETDMKSISKEFDGIIEKTKEVKSASVKRKEEAEKTISYAEKVAKEADKFLDGKK